MKKTLAVFNRLAPFSYLFLAALFLGIVKYGVSLGGGHQSALMSRLLGLITLYQYGVILFFLLWILVLGCATLLGKKITLKELSFAMIPLLFFLMIGEVACRFIGTACDSTQASPEVQSMYHPDVINGIAETRRRSGQLNAYGFRGRDFDFDKKADDFVIVLLGGSTATGAYASSFENTPAVFLEDSLKEYIKRKYRKNLKVYSLAESAADVEDEAFWLFKLGIHLKPDVVVSLTGYNNMHHALEYSYWDFSSGARGFRRPGIKIVQNLGVNKIMADIAALGDSKLNKYSSMYRMVKCKLGNRADPLKMNSQSSSVEKNKSASPEAARRFWGTIAGIRTFCRAKNIEYVVVLQPFATCGPAKRRLLPANGTSDNLEQFIYRNLIGQQKGVNLDSLLYTDTTVKLSDKLDSLNLFADSCHLWDKGFVMLDSEIVDYLKTKL